MKKLILLLPVIILLGCNVQKRKYQKGYHFAWNKHNTLNQPAGAYVHNEQNNSKQPKPPAPVSTKENLSEHLSVSLDKGTPASPTQKKWLKQLPDTCDKILFLNGDEAKVKVTEISATEVKYRKCDMLTGPDYIASRKSIFMITYSNGTKEKFTEAKPDIFDLNGPATKKSTSYKKDEELAIYSLVCGIAGIIINIGSIAAIVLGIKALKKIKKDPNRYGGKELAIIGIGLGILKFILLLLIVIIILTLFL